MFDVVIQRVTVADALSASLATDGMSSVRFACVDPNHNLGARRGKTPRPRQPNSGTGDHAISPPKNDIVAARFET